MSLVYARNHKRSPEDQRDFSIEDSHRRKRPKSKSKRLSRLENEEIDLARPKHSNHASDSPSRDPTAAATTFLDNSFYYTSGSDRSVESYQQYLDSVANSVESHTDVEHAGFRDSRYIFSASQQWSSGIPDDERIIELDDSESEGAERVTREMRMKDPRAPTLAKILNFDGETVPINEKKASRIP